MSETVRGSREELGLRERKKRATRSALQYAALTLVAERGIDNVTVDDVTTEVGVSQRTFFNYFATKEEALIGADPDLLDRLVAALRARPEHEPPLYALRQVLVIDAERVAEAKEIWRLRMALHAEHPEIFHSAASASERINSALADVIAQRCGTDVDADPYARLVVGVAAAARRTALQLWARKGFSRPYPEIMSQCFDELHTLLPTAHAQ